MSKDVPFFKSPYNFDVLEASKDSALVIPEDEEVLTQQQFREDCDINEIVRRFGLTGKLPEPWSAPTYGDFTGAVDFHTAQNLVLHAQAEFDRLPAELRERFGHDPQQLLAFLDDGSNRDEAIALGLVAKPPEVLKESEKPVE